MLLYKSRVLGYLEYRTPALYHATNTVLANLDKVQDNFLRDLGLTKLQALMEFNLAPLSTRRDVAMLGLVHRTVLKQGPSHFQSFFQQRTDEQQGSTRLARRRHGKQLQETRTGRFLEVLRRSALGLAGVYNLLPTEVVAETTVAGFQRLLQNLLKERATSGCEDWEQTFSPRVPLYLHPLR